MGLALGIYDARLEREGTSSEQSSQKELRVIITVSFSQVGS